MEVVYAILYWPVQAELEALLDLLLGTQVVGVPALLLAAVDGAGVQAGVALAADHLVAVVLLGQLAQGGFDDSPSQAQH